MSTHSNANANKLIIAQAQKLLKDFGHDVKTTHLYEIFARLSQEKNWHVAKARNLAFDHIWNKPNEAESQDDLLLSRIPTGLTKLDIDLNGGLPRGSVTTIFGSANSKKSLFCTSLGASALRVGLKVLHIALDDSYDATKRNYFTNLSKNPTAQVTDQTNSLTPPTLLNPTKVKAIMENLQFASFLKDPDITFETILKYCQDVYKIFKFDLLIIDYVQLIKQSKENLYGLDSLAKELNCVILSPAQTSNTSLEKPFSGFSDSTDSLALGQISGIILSLNQNAEESQTDSFRLLLEKNLRGTKGGIYGIRAKFDLANLVDND
jgi:archaellum biogenesis ATPase FlaH